MGLEFKQTFRVRWVDTDNAGVMHFSNFLRYVEACEEELYRALGLTFKAIQAKYQITFPRVEVHCRYRAACRFDDLIEVALTVKEVAEKTVTYDFEIVRKHDNKLAADGYLKVIAVNSNWKAVQIPAEIAKEIHKN